MIMWMDWHDCDWNELNEYDQLLKVYYYIT